MVRKTTILFFICTMLCSCAVPEGDISDMSRQSDAVSDSAAAISGSVVREASVVSNSATVVSGSGAVSKGSDKQPVIVTDMTGQEHELKLGDVDAGKREGVPFSLIEATAVYSQVEGDHYYFMRSDGKRNYTIYRDKRSKVGRFSLKRGYVEYFARYCKKFYALVREDPKTQHSSKNYYRSLKLVEIDLKRQSTLGICDLSSDLGMDERKNDPIPIGLFQGTFLYLDGMKLGRFDIEKKKVVSNTSEKIFIKKEPWDWIYLEDKIYYAIRYEDKVIIYRLDLGKGTTDEIFEYTCVDVFGQPEVIQSFIHGTEVVLDVDKDYLYCQGYGIPRRGGEMVRLFRYEIETVNYLPYAYTDQFAYYMDFNGENVKRIWKGQ